MNLKRLKRLKMLREGEVRRVERALVEENKSLAMERALVAQMSELMEEYFAESDLSRSAQALHNRTRFLSSLQNTVDTQRQSCDRLQRSVDALSDEWRRRRSAARALEAAVEKCAADHKRSVRKREERAQVFRAKSML